MTTTTPDARSSWTQVEDATSRFLGFLHGAVEKGGPLKDWHAIFSIGTVTRIRDGTPEFTGYSPLWPKEEREHFTSEEGARAIHARNVRTWESQRSHPDPDVQRAIRRAYHLLTQDGYPYPGGEGSDRMAVPMQQIEDDSQEVLWMILWMHREPNVFSLAIDSNPGMAVASSGTGRRTDYLEPRVHAVISPTLQVTVLGA